MSDTTGGGDRFGDLPYDELIDEDGNPIPLVDISDALASPASQE